MSRGKIPVLLLARELHIGGSERQMTETAKRLDRSLFEPHVGCFRPAGIFGEELRDAGVSVIQWPITSYRSAGAARGALDIARYIRRNAIRIVHTWDYPLTTFAIPVTRLATPALAISSQRSERVLVPGLYRRMLPICDRFAHAIVVNCKFLERQLTEQHVPAAKIRVCHNGIDLDRFQRSALPHSLTVGVVCVLRPEKNLELLMDAFALVRDAAAELRLVIIGDGPELAGLREHARRSAIEKVCHFEPATSQVAQRLSAIDIFVLPSRSEAFSNSLMEAMACGCCILASNVGGNPELVRNGETGVLFRSEDAGDLADKLRTLIRDPVLRAKLAESGCRFIRNGFSISVAAERMQNIYLDLDRTNKGT